ncbi:uncharacterized protein LOC132563333 [Ylistrum balloti]|uniref:uncharacterized protein LOC132563333 n=1 Tax=Ylistrum balloti TaxID=509963 RepID=UPI002905BF7E|nr:uncharacterized protein LOC132563333 [Ylistrum balloti]XP_060084077.1 uncharacterized protein LOC132563333 [Ylistrum balloti]
MDSLIDGLDSEKWQETDESSLGEGFVTYHLNRNHKRVDTNSILVLIAVEDGEGKHVTLAGTKANKDPLKNIGQCDLKLDADEKFIVGINLDGDCVVCK